MEKLSRVVMYRLVTLSSFVVDLLLRSRYVVSSLEFHYGHDLLVTDTHHTGDCDSMKANDVCQTR
jgi:hypothetical protein